MELVILFVTIGVVSIVVGVLVSVRVMRAVGQVEPPGAEAGLSRLRAEVHTGSEQTLIGLVRELGLPRSAHDAAYGALYIEPSADDSLLVRSASALDRGLLSVITFRRAQGCTAVSYAIVRLPSDEAVHRRVLNFEAQLVGAIRRVDREADIRLSSNALRALASTRTDPASAGE